MISEVYNINCMEYMKTLPDGFFDLAICDPPYTHKENGQIQGGRFHGGRFTRYAERKGVKTQEELQAWDVQPDREWFEEICRVSKNQIIWGANYFDFMPMTRCFIVWDKKQSEHFSMAMCEYAWTSFNQNAKIYRQQPQSKTDSRFHPTQKPVELYGWLIQNYAKSGDKIFDPMMGSQTSRIAAYKLGYDYWGCELDETYFKLGCVFFEQECLNKTLLSDGTSVQQLTIFD